MCMRVWVMCDTHMIICVMCDPYNGSQTRVGLAWWCFTDLPPSTFPVMQVTKSMHLLYQTIHTGFVCFFKSYLTERSRSWGLIFCVTPGIGSRIQILWKTPKLNQLQRTVWWVTSCQEESWADQQMLCVSGGKVSWVMKATLQLGGCSQNSHWQPTGLAACKRRLHPRKRKTSTMLPCFGWLLLCYCGIQQRGR